MRIRKLLSGLLLATMLTATPACATWWADFKNNPAAQVASVVDTIHPIVNIADVMHKNPRTIGPDRLAVEAVKLMETHRINQLLVADQQGKLVGALHIHDLTRAKVI